MPRRAHQQDLDVARRLALQVTSNRPLELAVTDLLEMFGVSRLTDAARERLGGALELAGLSTHPPVHAMQRGGRVTLAQKRAKRPWSGHAGRISAIAAVLLLLCAVVVIDGGDARREHRASEHAAATATPTPDLAAERRAVLAVASQRFEQGSPDLALAAVRELGDDDLLDYYERRIARSMLRSARSALLSKSYRIARIRAQQARSYHRMPGSGRVIVAARAGIDAQRRAARLARDRRTCDSGERALVRSGGIMPSGCSSYAAELVAERARVAQQAAREAAEAAPAIDVPSDDGDRSGNWCGASRDGDGDGIWCEGE
jgi:hypothetical protein